MSRLIRAHPCEISVDPLSTLKNNCHFGRRLTDKPYKFLKSLDNSEQNPHGSVRHKCVSSTQKKTSVRIKNSSLQHKCITSTQRYRTEAFVTHFFEVMFLLCWADTFVSNWPILIFFGIVQGFQKRQLGNEPVEDVPVWGCASWRKGQLGEVPVWGYVSLGT